MFSLERFRNLIGKLLHLNDTPKRIALAFAIGVFIGFSPPTGLHAALALVLAWIIGLNKVIMVLGTFVNNPWTLVPIYGSCLWIGLHLYGEHRIPPMDWSSVMPGNLIHHFEDAGAQGESLLAALTSTAVYFIGQFRSVRSCLDWSPASRLISSSTRRSSNIARFASIPAVAIPSNKTNNVIVSRPHDVPFLIIRCNHVR
jgi:uncharacterized protein (DUF2062 family)